MAERTLIHASEKFRVERLHEPLSTGGTRERDVVVHAGAAVILPVLADGRIVMIRNFRVTIDAELLELPAGTLDSAESPAACAARELSEETGYAATQLRPLLSFFATPGFCTERMHVFVATGLSAGPSRPEANERIRVEPRTLAAALEAVRSGDICDAKTIVALLYFARFGGGEGVGA